MSEVKAILSIVLSRVKTEEDLWDNSDIIRNWKISERTLADWRKKEMISYVQVQNKIWYSREARELFLKDYMVDRDLKLGGSGHGR